MPRVSTSQTTEEKIQSTINWIGNITMFLIFSRLVRRTKRLKMGFIVIHWRLQTTQVTQPILVWNPGDEKHLTWNGFCCNHAMAIDRAPECIWICPHGQAEGGDGWVQNQYFIRTTRGLVNDQDKDNDKYNYNDKRFEFRFLPLATEFWLNFKHNSFEGFKFPQIKT